ncbi:MAG TPA: hypothetical protein VK074_07355 [Fodinibius sp.]|nr:hypothetical protein [Fodinibius sp.]
MDITKFDRDEILTSFLTDYIDGKLNTGESRAFEEYLSNNPKEHEFARKALKAKKMLNRLADSIDLSALQNNSQLTTDMS